MGYAKPLSESNKECPCLHHNSGTGRVGVQINIQRESKPPTVPTTAFATNKSQILLHLPTLQIPRRCAWRSRMRWSLFQPSWWILVCWFGWVLAQSFWIQGRQARSKHFLLCRKSSLPWTPRAVGPIVAAAVAYSSLLSDQSPSHKPTDNTTANEFELNLLATFQTLSLS